MLLHDEMVDCGDDQDDDHDYCLGCAGDVVVGVADEEEETDQGYFQHVNAGEELRESIVEEKTVRVYLVSLDEVVIVAIGYPEEGECARDEEEHQRGDDAVDEAWIVC